MDDTNRIDPGAVDLDHALTRYGLDQVGYLMLKATAENPTISGTELADMLGMSVSAVCARQRKPAFQAAVRELTRTTEAHLGEAARLAARRLKTLVLLDDPAKAEPYIRLALSNHLGKAAGVAVGPAVVTYRTNIQPDGSLLREVVLAELGPDAAAAPVDKPVDSEAAPETAQLSGAESVDGHD